MIKANFKTYSNYVTDSLYQWDLNRVLTVSGLNLSVAPEVHFSNANMERAIVRQGSFDNNRNVVVNIPNSLLQDPLRIKVHVGIYEGEEFKVLELIEIPVIPRKRPSDYRIEDTDEEIYSFVRLENMIANINKEWNEVADQKITASVNSWLDKHPEATTTVQDGALTEPKFSENLKLKAIKDYVTPQMFGAKGDGVTDDSEAFRNALLYVYENANINGSWKIAPKIFIPKGNYVIKSTLINDTTGVNTGQFTIEGDTQYGTKLLIDTEVLFDNQDIFGYTIFRNISFVGNDGTFMNLYSRPTGTAQSFIFENCEFYGFHTVVNCSGSIMCSEVTFRDCKIRQCGSPASLCELFILDNTQAVNWRFYATDIEVFYGTLFKYLQGSNVSYYQGSIIPINNSIIISVPSEANVNTFGGGNAPHINMNGVRFELRNTSRLIESNCFQSLFTGCFTNCGMGGMNLGDGVKPLNFVNSGFRLFFTNCYNMVSYCGDFTFNTNYNFKRSILKFSDSDINADDFVDGSGYNVTGGNYGYLPKFIFNDRRYCLGYVSISETDEKNVLLIDWTLGNGFYLTSDGDRTFTVLIDAFVKSIDVDNIRKLTAFGSETFTVRFSDTDGDLGSVTGNINTVKDNTIVVNKYIKYLTINSTSSYNGNAYAPLLVSANILA